MILRNMTRDELAAVLGWAASEGWNPGLDDAQPFFDTDPDGFFVAEADGALVAAISVVNHSDSFAFLGLYLCLPENRGRGIGMALWSHALNHAGDRTVGLDGVPAQQGNYRRSGFGLAGETQRFEGKVAAKPSPAVRGATPDDLPLLIAMEAAANGYRKDRFLAGWLAEAPTRKTLVMGPAGAPTGFVTIRKCGRGAKIGPLVAPDADAATTLIHAAAALEPDGPAVIDVPGDDAALAEYCQRLGMECSFTTARMYRGPAPAPGKATRTIATFELG